MAALSEVFRGPVSSGHVESRGGLPLCPTPATVLGGTERPSPVRVSSIQASLRARHGAWDPARTRVPQRSRTNRTELLTCARVYVVCLYLYDAFTRGEHTCVYTHVRVHTHKGVYTRDSLQGIGSSLKTYSLQAGGPGKPKVEGSAQSQQAWDARRASLTRAGRQGKTVVSFVGSLSVVPRPPADWLRPPHQRGPRA